MIRNFLIVLLIMFLRCSNLAYMLFYTKELSLELHSLSLLWRESEGGNENEGNVLLFVVAV